MGDADLMKKIGNLRIDSRLKTHPRVIEAMGDLINLMQGIGDAAIIKEFDSDEERYGFDCREGNLVVQHLYYKRFEGSEPKKCIMEIIFSVDPNGNVVETRELFVKCKDGSLSVFNDLRRKLIITYDPYGIEMKFELEKYEQKKESSRYVITRMPEYPFAACLERMIKIPSGDDKGEKIIKSSQYILLDGTDIRLLVPEEHVEGSYSEILTGNDLRALGKKRGTIFNTEKDIEKYRKEHLRTIGRAFEKRREHFSRPLEIDRALTPEKSSADKILLKKGNKGLNEMAKKAGIPVYGEKIRNPRKLPKNQEFQEGKQRAETRKNQKPRTSDELTI